MFLERSQLLWLRGVLQEAAGKGWSLPSKVGTKSSRRALEVSHFILRGIRMLKISEVVRGGKLFFIKIPWDPISRGWRPLLRALILEDGEVFPIPMVRTFAEVTRRRVLSVEGGCVLGGTDAERFIQVTDDGVAEWLNFLECCVVLHFESVSVVDWPEFRKWAAASWGTPMDVPIRHLADDVWMVVCSSKGEVARILGLNRRSFEAAPMETDLRSVLFQSKETASISLGGVGSTVSEEGCFQVGVRLSEASLSPEKLFQSEKVVGGELTEGPCQATRPLLSEEVSGAFCRGSSFVGLRLKANEFLVGVPPFRFDQLEELKGLLSAVGAGKELLPGFQYMAGPIRLLASEVSFSSLGEGVILGEFRIEEVGASLKEVDVVSVVASSEGSGGEPVCRADELPEIPSLVPEVEEVASLIDLRLHGSLAKGKEPTVASCRESNIVWASRRGSRQ
ncbi:hypothetical protein LINPERHAP2_LOCUS14725 [Linum perenne]